MPSVRLSGLVQSVSIEEPIIRRISRTAINTAVLRPSAVILRNPHCQRTRPSIINMFRVNVNSRIMIIGLRPRTIKLNGTLDTAITVPRHIAAMANPIKLSTIKSSIMNSKVAIIFTLGSSR